MKTILNLKKVPASVKRNVLAQWTNGHLDTHQAIRILRGAEGMVEPPPREDFRVHASSGFHNETSGCVGRM